jgi:hypothetical protein
LQLNVLLLLLYYYYYYYIEQPFLTWGMWIYFRGFRELAWVGWGGGEFTNLSLISKRNLDFLSKMNVGNELITGL